jgi:hypothetical protein
MPVVKEIRTAFSGRAAVLTALGFALAAYPVYQHSKVDPSAGNPYAAAKKKAREEKLRWIESDEMPLK